VLSAVWSTELAPDGRTLYAAMYDSHGFPADHPGLSVFRVDPGTGGLTPLSGTDHCITNDGDSTEGEGTCVDGRGFGEQERITVSADGRSLYATGRSSGVQVLALDPATGKATQLPGVAGCLSDDGGSLDGPGTCTDLRVTGGTHALALSPDQAFGYFGSLDGDGSVAVVSRQVPPVCAGTTFATAFATPFTVVLPCSDPNGDPVTREIVGGPAHGALGGIDQATGKVVYTPAAGFSGADGFTYRAVDAAGASATTPARITVGAEPPPPDTAAPVCARAGGKTLSRKRLTVSLRCGEGAALRARLTLPRKVAKRLRIGGRARRVTIAGGRAQAAAGATAKVQLKLTRKARKRLRALPGAKLRKLRPTLTVKATDVAGNTATLAAKVRFKR
jgi:hypothetical protein